MADGEKEGSAAMRGSVVGDIVARLRRTVAGSRRWYRNPDGPEVADEIERLRLTDAEKTEIRRLIEDYEQDGEPASQRCVDTLRCLLERLK